MPSPNPDLIYEIKHHRIRVIKIVEGNWFTICHRRYLYSYRLSENFVDSLRLSIQEQDLMHLDSSYASSVMDGVSWTLVIQDGTHKKTIFLENYYLSQLDTILLKINGAIPSRYRLINFNLFGIKEKYLNASHP